MCAAVNYIGEATSRSIF